jgi:hypothetical protein
MASDLLRALRDRIDEDLEGATVTPDGLRAPAEIRYGDVVVAIDHDLEAASVRIGVAVPPPAGAGGEFLLWCLGTSTQYWDIKIGLDDEGFLLVHSDLDADDDVDLGALATMVVDRAETILDLLEEDLVEWLLSHGLGTPAQRERWETRGKRDDDDQVADEAAD